MKNALNKNLNERTLNVQTYSWPRFGNNIPSGDNAILEIIMNGYSAGIINRDINGNATEPMRIDVDLRQVKGSTYLVIQNTGVPADLQRVLDYGRENHGTSLNQFGTGFKSAASFFNPANDGWCFVTKTDNSIWMAQAPYSDTMVIKELDAWPFDDWSISCAQIRVDDETKLEGITKEMLGYLFAPAIDDGLRLNFNGEPVIAIKPNGAATSCTSVEDVDGKKVNIDYATYIMGDDAEGERFFPMGLDGQGVYVYVNNCFAAHMHGGLIRKSTAAFKDDSSSKFLKPHPSMNHLIAVVNIKTPHDHSIDVPFNNNKTNIKWQSNIGKMYRDAIDRLVGDFFRAEHDKAIENRKRKFLDEFCTKLAKGGTFEFECEYSIKNIKGKKYAHRCDAVLGTKRLPDGTIDPYSVKTIIEYKVGKTCIGHVCDALEYYDLFRMNYGIAPNILIAGPELDEETIRFIKFKRERDNVDIEYINWENA